MNSTSVIATIGMLAIAVVGIGRHRPANGPLGEWTVGERKFSTFTTWFLQAGESFTTFSFLGLAGLAFGGGVAASYALCYLAINFVLQYFTAPRMRQLGAEHGYLTQADFFAERYRSPLLGRVVAIVGAVFLLPYLQLQITGLGLIVQLATGSRTGGNLSMILATVLTVGFVLWSGIRGVARVAYLKDALMVVGLLVLFIGVAISVKGGIGGLFETVRDTHPDLLTLHQKGYDATFFVSAVIISGIGGGLGTMAHLWPPVLAARSGRALRSNAIWLPLYQIALGIPVIVGFAGILMVSPDSPGNAVALTLAGQTLPGWLVGVVAVAAASAAMVPSAAIIVGISSLLSRNVLSVRSERTQLRTNHVCAVVAAALALCLGLSRPDLLANLLLLTFGGLSQLAPAIVMGLARKVRLDAIPVLLGILTGVAVLTWLTFGDVDLGTMDPGLVALLPNLAVTGVAQLVVRSRTSREEPGGVRGKRVGVA
ncbi:sodium:solute symporter family protein [Streptomyces sp. NBC_00440]|uniref:sodium:solute symporter family protein n=1 Tax=unclassified Streptomyces TaxID=2593676 RepID=UPI002E1F45DD|nr:sodium:solute symporter family protein [Streptomyces sp. NBC_00963]WSX65730.1 sodium:solute symporter family protein [Streptomyces sp. NBC_00932]